MRRTPAVPLLVVLLLAPSALAWGAMGSYEPSTTRDRTDGYMFATAPQSTADAGKIYFNGWVGPVSVMYTNGNLASQESGLRPAGQERAWAMLGVWRDCNKDGYVGYGDQGIWEYKSELLTVNGGPGASVCPVVSVPGFIPNQWEPAASGQLAHNDGKWVHEWIPIGWNTWATQYDEDTQKFVVNPIDPFPWDLNDSESRVWSDFDLPETVLEAGDTGCTYRPLPRGTTQSTGGAIEFLDCFAGGRVAGTINDAAATDPVLAPLSFADKPGDERNSSSILNVKNPWGHEKDAAIVSAWDCDEPDVANFRNPKETDASTGEVWVNVSAPRVPPDVNAGGSAGGTVNETASGADDCDRANNAGSPRESLGMTPYATEGDVVNSDVRVEPDNSFSYNDGNRRGGPNSLTGPGAPADFGVRPTGFECALSPAVAVGCFEGFWVSDTVWSGGAPTGVSHHTFYAHVGASLVQRLGLRLPTARGVYGAPVCPTLGAGAPDQNGWACDPAKWWPAETMPRSSQLGKEPADANRPPENMRDGAYGVRVGQPYELRDIDCADWSTRDLRNEGLTIGNVRDAAESLAAGVLADTDQTCA